MMTGRYSEMCLIVQKKDVIFNKSFFHHSAKINTFIFFSDLKGANYLKER